MLRKIYLYWRWVRRSRARAQRLLDHAAGDNYPVLIGVGRVTMGR